MLVAMYCPNPFDERRPELLQAHIDAHPLATLVRLAPDGLSADHVPLLLRREGPDHGTMVGHVARANPLWQQAAGSEVLLVFGGAQGYVSPNWYATKQETGKVVPTWNYAVVHVWGRLRAVEDADWLRQLLTELTDRHERPQPRPWQLDDAPADYTGRLLGAIVGIEIPIARLQGKWKLSQNQPAANQAGVLQGLAQGQDAERALGSLMQDYLSARSQP